MSCAYPYRTYGCRAPNIGSNALKLQSTGVKFSNVPLHSHKSGGRLRNLGALVMLSDPVSRTRELVSGGMRLKDACKQVAREFDDDGVITTSCKQNFDAASKMRPAPMSICSDAGSVLDRCWIGAG